MDGTSNIAFYASKAHALLEGYQQESTRRQDKISKKELESVKTELQNRHGCSEQEAEKAIRMALDSFEPGESKLTGAAKRDAKKLTLAEHSEIADYQARVVKEQVSAELNRTTGGAHWVDVEVKPQPGSDGRRDATITLPSGVTTKQGQDAYTTSVQPKMQETLNTTFKEQTTQTTSASATAPGGQAPTETGVGTPTAASPVEAAASTVTATNPEDEFSALNEAVTSGKVLVRQGTYTVQESVKDLQTLLNRHRPEDTGELKIDGKFGPLTEQAVKNFQTKHNLRVDGAVGPETLAKLFEVERLRNSAEATFSLGAAKPQSTRYAIGDNENGEKVAKYEMTYASDAALPSDLTAFASERLTKMGSSASAETSEVYINNKRVYPATTEYIEAQVEKEFAQGSNDFPAPTEFSMTKSVGENTYAVDVKLLSPAYTSNYAERLKAAMEQRLNELLRSQNAQVKVNVSVKV